MRIDSKAAEFDALLDLAKKLCVVARTAPKACAKDTTDTVILTGEEKAELSAEMRKLGEEIGVRGKLFIRDASNIDAAQVIVLFGATYEARGLNEICQVCGFENCKACLDAGATCVYAGIDLGIALGSAASMAARDHADNRIFFTAGKAAKRLRLLGDHTLIMGIPLFAGGKNPFFDRSERKPE